MYKFVMCAIMIISTTFMGNSFSQRLSNRRKCLCEVIESVSRMKSLITFSGLDIQKVVADSFKNTCMSGLFTESKFDTDDFSLWWRGAVNSIDKSTGINKEDKELLRSLGDGLGVTDIAGQLAHLELYSQLFSQRLSSAKDSEKEKGRLYRVLGFSLGCAVTLVVM